ncbi:hypothetical protein ACFSJU_08640 [Paradesertivirga mongoliensis]|uniref:YtxH domain-containing protein n=1 Tax=Paradesertivirga mongoliensis TaxID=2100740 RepID=A0ABW4ZLG5_9SPHI|nr:hypothetical protein [Pedobacter mongoliensis]
MKNTTLWSIVAGAAAAGAILYYKRNEVSRMGGNLKDSARNWGDKLTQYGSELKDRFLNNVKGPNGEAVYLDMYDRQFYENEMGQRVYLDAN